MTLYSIDEPFQLVHADVANLELLGKSATHPKYCQLVVSRFTSKIYTYLMRSRRNLAKKTNKFYIDVAKIKQKKQEKTKGFGFTLIKNFNRTKLKS